MISAIANQKAPVFTITMKNFVGVKGSSSPALSPSILYVDLTLLGYEWAISNGSPPSFHGEWIYDTPPAGFTAYRR